MLSVAAVAVVCMVMFGSAIGPARAGSSNAGAVIGGLLGAILGEIIGHRIAVRNDLAAETELLREQLTELDESNLKAIGTGLEEYAVDHNGRFPSTLSAMTPLYLQSVPWVPGSNPPTQYVYEFPASRPEWGKWAIKDDGSLDPTLFRLRAPDDTLCTHATCKYIVYAEAGGLLGSP